MESPMPACRLQWNPIQRTICHIKRGCIMSLYGEHNIYVLKVNTRPLIEEGEGVGGRGGSFEMRYHHTSEYQCSKHNSNSIVNRK